MAWTALTFSYGSVLTSSKMTQLFDNFAAMAAGSASAPIISATNMTGNTSGNATTATNLSGDQTNWVSYNRTTSVANMLGWKNFGNGSVIFDASASTSPTGSAVNNTASTYPWIATYPTLMGWNGSSTYGVRVDVCRLADSATNATNATTSTTQSVGTNSTAIATTAFCEAGFVNNDVGAVGIGAIMLGNAYDSGIPAMVAIASGNTTAIFAPFRQNPVTGISGYITTIAGTWRNITGIATTAVLGGVFQRIS